MTITTAYNGLEYVMFDRGYQCITLSLSLCVHVVFLFKSKEAQYGS
jgi:hypothetical protein